MKLAVTFETYVTTVVETQAMHPTWRPGQTFFNILLRLRPDIAEDVRGTVIDPFYSDAVVPEFLTHVRGAW